MRKITGYCPMGCGQTLFVGDGGYITCSFIHCPRPSAVADILEDRETEHVVQFSDQIFNVRHPLLERLDDKLMSCELHDWIFNLDGPPVRPGKYRAVTRTSGGWKFTPAEAAR